MSRAPARALKSESQDGLEFGAALERLRKGVPQERVLVMLTEAPTLQWEIWRLLLEGLSPTERDFNASTVFCTSDTGLGEIEALGEELPILSDRRFVWVRDAHALADAQAERLATYLGEASPQTWFFVTAAKKASSEGRGQKDDGDTDEAKKSPKKNIVKRVSEALGDAALVINGDISDKEAWLRAEFKRQGVAVEPAALEMLLSRMNADKAKPGSELPRLLTEVEKLCCHAGDEAVVNASAVDALVRNDARRMAWDVTQALEKGDLRGAILTLEKLLDDGAEPLMVLGWLSSRYRQLVRVKALMEQGSPPDRIASQLKLSPFAARYACEYARRFRGRDLEDAIEALLETDMALKTGKRHERFHLELLLLRLGRLGGARR